MTNDQNKPEHQRPGSEAAPSAHGAASQTILNALMSSRAIVEQGIRAERDVETLNLRGVLAEINAAIQAVQARLLWCVHVTGPDDIIAMPTYEACIALCDKINGYVERIRAAHLDDPNWPITRAYPAPYPWSDEQYAAALRAGSPEYGVEPLPSFPKEGDNG